MKWLILTSVMLLGVEGTAMAVGDRSDVTVAITPPGIEDSTAKFLCHLSRLAATESLNSSPTPRLINDIDVNSDSLELEMCSSGYCSDDFCSGRSMGEFCVHIIHGVGYCRPQGAICDGLRGCTCSGGNIE